MEETPTEKQDRKTGLIKWIVAMSDRQQVVVLLLLALTYTGGDKKFSDIKHEIEVQKLQSQLENCHEESQRKVDAANRILLDFALKERNAQERIDLSADTLRSKTKELIKVSAEGIKKFMK